MKLFKLAGCALLDISPVFSVTDYLDRLSTDMSLRLKTIVIGIITIVAVLLIVNIIGYLVIVDGFKNIEVRSVNHSLTNTLSLINDKIYGLDLRARDWARWDDTYQFILGNNDSYINNNLSDDTFANLDINLIAIADKSGKILYTREYDHVNGIELNTHEKFREAIHSDDKLISNITDGETVSGILIIDDDVMLVASCPVTDSLQKSPFAGSLIFGRRLESAELEKISMITGENVTFFPKAMAGMPTDVAHAMAKVNSSNPIFIQPLNDDRIAGYILINDLYGSPDLILRMETVRDVYNQGQTSYLYYVIVGSLGALIALAIAVFVLDRLIMQRIAGLNKSVKALAGNGDHGKRLDIAGRDEVGSLALQINSMLDTLQQSYGKITEQETKYRLVTNNITDIITMLDMDLNTIFYSPSVLRGRGYTDDEFLSLSLDQQMTAESYSIALRTFHDVMKAEAESPGSFESINLELEIYRKDGTSFWTDNVLSFIRDEQGKPVKILCVGRDISEKKQAEKVILVQRDLAVKLSGTTSMTEAVRTIIETACTSTGMDCGLVYMVREDGKLDMMCLRGFSPAYLETASLLDGKTISGKWAVSNVPIYADKDENSLDISEAEEREGIVSYALIPVYEKTGVIAYLLVGSHKITCISRENRRLLESITGLMGSVVARLKAEEDLRESESKYQTLTESSTNGVGIVQDGIYKYINRTAAAMLGYSREELIDKPFLSIVAPEWMDMVAERHRKRLTGQPAPEKYEVGMLCKDGSVRDVELSGSLISYKGKPAAMAVIADITEKKRWENRRLVAQKLESVGVLAGGIAHDFNNILAAILGNISLARISNIQDPEVDEQLTKAEKACVRAKDLTQQLLTFAKGGAPVKNTRSLVSLLQDSANFALSGSNVKAEFEINSDLWPADIDAEQISRVIHNLVVNADQAMPGGGIIRIGAENIVLKDVNSLSLKGGRFIKISVIDHGEGIPARNIKYIFDPYFTTRQKGSGLGLAMSYSVIKNHGGTISVDSAVGTGTTFSVYLPASEQLLTDNPIEDFVSCSLNAKRVLLVDDEEMIRDVTGRILKHMGVGEILVASDGREALQVYKNALTCGNPVDVVIMDLTIPGGMGGKEALQEMLKIDPGTKAIVSSGYASDPILSEYRKYGFKGVLVKPYKIQELDKVLCEVMNSRS